MTKISIIWISENWNLFGACLPAGRQGIWLLEFVQFFRIIVLTAFSSPSRVSSNMGKISWI
jgi:hypothetical protein